MFEFVEGNLLDARVDALVNAVNTEGVMGKGIALQFRNAFPEMFEAYPYGLRNGRGEAGSDAGMTLLTSCATGSQSNSRLFAQFASRR